MIHFIYYLIKDKKGILTVIFKVNQTYSIRFYIILVNKTFANIDFGRSFYRKYKLLS